jgi:hypothetical protein
MKVLELFCHMDVPAACVLSIAITSVVVGGNIAFFNFLEYLKKCF